MKDCEKPLKSAVASCLDWWRMSGYEFLVYITKFSEWKKFAKDIGKEQMRALFGMSQSHGQKRDQGIGDWLGSVFPFELMW